MFKVGQQIVVSRSTGVVGIEVGHTGTIVHIEYYGPVCPERHEYFRFLLVDK